MTEPAKILPAAKKFIERFGQEAPTEARRRAMELRYAGNASGWATWMLMYKAAKALVADDTDEAKH